MVIGKYIRLSQADQDVMKKENKTESESIAHQRDLIQRYINSHADLKNCGVREFYDDGYSGTNFKRPAFERLLEQIKKGKIGCVIVKDFSRFGRDYIELGDYLERIFPFLGVRFISVNDGYDSNDYKGTTGGLDVVLKNIVYDFYSKDLSVKVITAKRAKMKHGEYIGGHVPYGLLRDPGDKHKLVIDPEAAAVVREIFGMAIEGKKLIDIARYLNEKGTETPAGYFRRKNPCKKKYRNTSALECWNDHSIRRILKQEMYYGAVVQHKREGIGVGWKHSVAVPKEEQVIVEGMHPGIVTKEEFLQAQKIFRKRGPAKRVVEKNYPLWRKVRCGACGRAMPLKSGIVRGVDYRYFYCQHAASQPGAGGCTKEYMREDVLNEAVWDSVKGLLAAAGSFKKKIGRKKEEMERNNAAMVKKLADLQKEKAKCEADRFTNMDQFMAGNMEKEVYQKRRAEFTREAERLDGLIAELETELQERETVQDERTKEALETVERFSGAEGLDQKIVDALIETVLVYDPGHVEIRWKFSDEVMKMMQNKGYGAGWSDLTGFFIFLLLIR
ncbi:MAG: recombinase family protein [Clostridium sp.]|nr:recombinase family protein [Clostridium sp.]